MKMPKVGDWGFVVGNSRITAEKWKSSYPQNWFGRVIEIRKLRWETLIIMRCYRNGEHPHLKTNKKYFKPCLNA